MIYIVGSGSLISYNSCVHLAKEFQSNYELSYAISPAICSTCSFIKSQNVHLDKRHVTEDLPK